MKSVYALAFAGLFAALFFSPGLMSSAAAKDTMEVIRDKDKTVYSIDSDDQAARDEERDKERAWQMLNNMNLWVGGRGRGPGGQPGAPANQ